MKEETRELTLLLSWLDFAFRQDRMTGKTGKISGLNVDEDYRHSYAALYLVLVHIQAPTPEYQISGIESRLPPLDSFIMSLSLSETQ